MATKNRFFKTTQGVDAQVFVGKAVAYTDDTTLKAFAANAVEGEVAIINAETNAVLSTLASAGTKVYFALKRDGNIETSTPFTIGKADLKKIVYSAPVKHQITVESSGTPATLTVGNIVYTAREVGEDGNDITITVVDGAGNNIPLSIAVTGTDIVVNLATDGASAPTTTGTLLLAALEAKVEAMALVSVAGTGTMSTVQAAASEAPLAGGVDEAAITKGKYAEVVVIETTPGLEPLPRWNYSVEAKANESYTELVTRLVAKINDPSAPENKNKTRVVDAAVVGVNNFTLTAIDFNSHFTVALRGIFADEASASVTQQFKIGSGTAEQAELAEIEGNIRKGIGVYYPVQNATAAEFGVPTSFVSTSNTYNVFRITFDSEDITRTLDKEFRRNYIFAYVPSNGTNPTTAIDTVLGTA